MRASGRRHFSKRPDPDREPNRGLNGEERAPQDLEGSNKSTSSLLRGPSRGKKRRVRLDESEAVKEQLIEPQQPEPSSFLAKLRKNKSTESKITPNNSDKDHQGDHQRNQRDTSDEKRPKPIYTAAPIPIRELEFVGPGHYTRIEEFNQVFGSLDPDIRALIEVPIPPSQEWWDEGVEASREIIHPVIACEKEPASQKVYLTAAEKARKRRNERQLNQAEARDRIKRGVDPPPPPKLSLSNVMAVTGSAYFQDPTKYDMIAKEAENQRRETHLQTNQERHEKSVGMKWETTQLKILEHRAQGIHSAVYRVDNLDGKQRFLLDYTAKKFLFTGALCIGTPTLVIVEGGEKEIRKYNKLVQSRIEWGGDSAYRLVWKGQLSKALFKKWSVHEMSPEEIKEFVAKFGCDGYWNLAT